MACVESLGLCLPDIGDPAGGDGTVGASECPEGMTWNVLFGECRGNDPAPASAGADAGLVPSYGKKAGGCGATGGSGEVPSLALLLLALALLVKARRHARAGEER